MDRIGTGVSMSNVVAELERRLEQAEDENDALELRLAKIEDALFGGERIPAAIVDRLALAVRRRFESQNLPIGLRHGRGLISGASEARRDHHRRSRPGAAAGPRFEVSPISPPRPIGASTGPDRFAAGSTGRSSIPPSPRETPVPDWSARYAELIAPEAET